MNVAAGADNLQDPFNLVGRGDCLETASLMVMAGHLLPEDAYHTVSNAARAALGLAPAGAEAGSPAASAAGQATLIMVKKLNGENVLWDGADLRKRIEFARIGLDLCLSNDEIEAELRRSVYDQISQKDLDATIILNSKTLIEKDADFAKFAGRIQLTYIYEETLPWRISDGPQALKDAHRKAFLSYIPLGIELGRLDPRLVEPIGSLADLSELGAKKFGRWLSNQRGTQGRLGHPDCESYGSATQGVQNNMSHTGNNPPPTCLLSASLSAQPNSFKLLTWPPRSGGVYKVHCSIGFLPV